MTWKEPPVSRDVYTVTRLNREARAVLEGGFPPIWLEGEISNLARPASGHLYFSLKDARCQVRCAMFRMRNLHLKFSPENGAQVLVRARVGLYEGRGEFQLVVERMEPAGEGALQQAFEALKQKLAAEGLFDSAGKRALPVLPRQIGVVTSTSGAAIRDVLSVLARRAPGIPVVIYPVPVQGESAPQQIVQMLERANRRMDCDVLLLTRGGGSLEDLWAFNDESLARAIHSSRIPVVCGVGHEIDFTIADFVADHRAPTPSAAAEMISPDREHWLQRLQQLGSRLALCQRRSLDQHRAVLNGLSSRLLMLHPGRWLAQQQQRTDELEQRLRRALGLVLERSRARLATSTSHLREQAPGHRVRRHQLLFSQLRQRLVQAWRTGDRRRRQQLHHLAGQLHALSPLATLDRGYAILSRADDGVILRRPEETRIGDLVDARLAHGTLRCRVESRVSDKKNDRRA